MRMALKVLIPASTVLVVALALFSYEKPVPLSEGIYQLSSEVSGFSGETLELRGGRFRYWFYSDVVTGREPSYPLSGTYSVSGDTLKLNNSSIGENKRTIATLNGVNVLWREDGLKLWKEEKRIQPYAVLIQNPIPMQGDEPPAPPSVKVIYTQEMRDLNSKRFEERFSDQPAEVRAILRARTSREDLDLSAYKAEVLKARAKLDPRLVQELVGLLGYNSGLGVDAQTILEDIFLPTQLMAEEPTFRRSREELHHALGILIDGLSAAPDRAALEEALLIYLRASGVLKMNLEIPEGGVRIRLEVTGSGAVQGSTMGSEPFGDASKHPFDHNWREKMRVITPVCQEWARGHLR